MNTTGTAVRAPQYGRGAAVLEDARVRRHEAQKEIARKQQEEEVARHALDVARQERLARIGNTTQKAAKLLDEGKYQDAQVLILNEIHCLLSELKTITDEQDRFWVAKRILHLTSWRGMKTLNDVEKVITSVFGENIPDEIAESLARLIDKQTEFLRKAEAKKAGVMRFGKTERDRQNGALRRHEQNRASRAVENRERAHGGNSGGGKGGKQKKKK